MDEIEELDYAGNASKNVSFHDYWTLIPQFLLNDGRRQLEILNNEDSDNDNEAQECNRNDSKRNYWNWNFLEGILKYVSGFQGLRRFLSFVWFHHNADDEYNIYDERTKSVFLEISQEGNVLACVSKFGQIRLFFIDNDFPNVPATFKYFIIPENRNQNQNNVSHIALSFDGNYMVLSMLSRIYLLETHELSQIDSFYVSDIKHDSSFDKSSLDNLDYVDKEIIGLQFGYSFCDNNNNNSDNGKLVSTGLSHILFVLTKSGILFKYHIRDEASYKCSCVETNTQIQCKKLMDVDVYRSLSIYNLLTSSSQSQSQSQSNSNVKFTAQIGDMYIIGILGCKIKKRSFQDVIGFWVVNENNPIGQYIGKCFLPPEEFQKQNQKKKEGGLTRVNIVFSPNGQFLAVLTTLGNVFVVDFVALYSELLSESSTPTSSCSSEIDNSKNLKEGLDLSSFSVYSSSSSSSANSTENHNIFSDIAWWKDGILTLCGESTTNMNSGLLSSSSKLLLIDVNIQRNILKNFSFFHRDIGGKDKKVTLEKEKDDVDVEGEKSIDSSLEFVCVTNSFSDGKFFLLEKKHMGVNIEQSLNNVNNSGSNRTVGDFIIHDNSNRNDVEEQTSYFLNVFEQLDQIELLRRYISRGDHDNAKKLLDYIPIKIDTMSNVPLLDILPMKIWGESAEVGLEELDLFSDIHTDIWVLYHCLSRVPSSIDITRSLLNIGLSRISSRTNKYLYLFQHSLSRLDLYCKIYQNAFDPEEFYVFRRCNIFAAALRYAASSDFQALKVLFESSEGPYLCQFFLHIIDSIPETAEVQNYSEFLSSKFVCELKKNLKKDNHNLIDSVASELLFVDLFENLSQEERLGPILDMEKGYGITHPFDVFIEPSVMEPFCQPPQDLHALISFPPSGEEWSSWYRERAIRIDKICGNLDISRDLIQNAIMNVVPGLENMYADVLDASYVIYEGSADFLFDLKLEDYLIFSTKEKLDCVLAATPNSKFVDILLQRVIPIFLRNHCDPKSFLESLKGFLLKKSLDFCAVFFEHVNTALHGSGDKSPILEFLNLGCDCLDKIFDMEDVGNSFEFLGLIFDLVIACLYYCSEPSSNGDGFAMTDSLIDSLTLLFEEIKLQMSNRHIAKESCKSIFDVEKRIRTVSVHFESSKVLDSYGLTKPLHYFLDEGKKPLNAMKLLGKMFQKQSLSAQFSYTDDKWQVILDDVLFLHEQVFDFVDKAYCYYCFCEVLLKVGAFDLARRYLSLTGRPEALILNSSRSFFNAATSVTDQCFHDAKKVIHLFHSYSWTDENLDVVSPLLSEIHLQESVEILDGLGLSYLPIQYRLSLERNDGLISILNSLFECNPHFYREHEAVCKALSKLPFVSDNGTGTKETQAIQSDSKRHEIQISICRLRLMAFAIYKSDFRVGYNIFLLLEGSNSPLLLDDHNQLYCSKQHVVDSQIDLSCGCINNFFSLTALLLNSWGSDSPALCRLRLTRYLLKNCLPSDITKYMKIWNSSCEYACDCSSTHVSQNCISSECLCDSKKILQTICDSSSNPKLIDLNNVKPCKNVDTPHCNESSSEQFSPSYFIHFPELALALLHPADAYAWFSDLLKDKKAQKSHDCFKWSKIATFYMSKLYLERVSSDYDGFSLSHSFGSDEYLLDIDVDKVIELVNSTDLSCSSFSESELLELRRQIKEFHHLMNESEEIEEFHQLSGAEIIPEKFAADPEYRMGILLEFSKKYGFEKAFKFASDSKRIDSCAFCIKYLRIAISAPEYHFDAEKFLHVSREILLAHRKSFKSVIENEIFFDLDGFNYSGFLSLYRILSTLLLSSSDNNVDVDDDDKIAGELVKNRMLFLQEFCQLNFDSPLPDPDFRKILELKTKDEFLNFFQPYTTSSNIRSLVSVSKIMQKAVFMDFHESASLNESSIFLSYLKKCLCLDFDFETLQKDFHSIFIEIRDFLSCLNKQDMFDFTFVVRKSDHLSIFVKRDIFDECLCSYSNSNSNLDLDFDLDSDELLKFLKLSLIFFDLQLISIEDFEGKLSFDFLLDIHPEEDISSSASGEIVFLSFKNEIVESLQFCSHPLATLSRLIAVLKSFNLFHFDHSNINNGNDMLLEICINFVEKHLKSLDFLSMKIFFSELNGFEGESEKFTIQMLKAVAEKLGDYKDGTDVLNKKFDDFLRMLGSIFDHVRLSNAGFTVFLPRLELQVLLSRHWNHDTMSNISFCIEPQNPEQARESLNALLSVSSTEIQYEVISQILDEFEKSLSTVSTVSACCLHACYFDYFQTLIDRKLWDNLFEKRNFYSTYFEDKSILEESEEFELANSLCNHQMIVNFCLYSRYSNVIQHSFSYFSSERTAPNSYYDSVTLEILFSKRKELIDLICTSSLCLPFLNYVSTKYHFDSVILEELVCILNDSDFPELAGLLQVYSSDFPSFLVTYDILKETCSKNLENQKEEKQQKKDSNFNDIADLNVNDIDKKEDPDAKAEPISSSNGWDVDVDWDSWNNT